MKKSELRQIIREELLNELDVSRLERSIERDYRKIIGAIDNILVAVPPPVAKQSGRLYRMFNALKAARKELEKG